MEKECFDVRQWPLSVENVCETSLRRSPLGLGRGEMHRRSAQTHTLRQQTDRVGFRGPKKCEKLETRWPRKSRKSNLHFK